MNTPRVGKAPSKLALKWKRLGPRFLPFADAATADLPLPRLLRLGLFQVSVGMATALMVGTLNRVMIVELGVAAWLVALMVALPIIAAPFRALIGHRSDVYASAIGWRRVPYVGLGAFLQFAGLALLPFALLLLTGEGRFGLAWVGHLVAGLSFLLVGAGLQTTQTAGLALASDLSTEATRPRVVALMYVMLLVGMVGGGTVFGLLLADFSATRLVQVVQGAGVVTAALCVAAVWKQEARNPNRRRSAAEPAPAFGPRWQSFIAQPKARRFLVTVGLGTAAFAMQDVVLEPYGGEILGLSVGATSSLTAVMAGGALLAFGLAARWLARGGDPYRVAALGLVLGLPAFAAVIVSAPAEAPWLFRSGTGLIGFGGGLFSVGMLTAAMSLEHRDHVGLALGAWGAVQATAGGLAIALGGGVRDLVSTLATHGAFGEVLVSPVTGYSFVYHLELYLLFAALIAIGPLVRSLGPSTRTPGTKFGLADLPS
ncbi:protein pucC [beta proteobacterium AAP121]|nr:protein pucC [beta proteobacterium AAP65]KPF97246.1 protein pucC [beta proteobacterium AAP121]